MGEVRKTKQSRCNIPTRKEQQYEQNDTGRKHTVTRYTVV